MEMNAENVSAVVITGLVVVFLGLLILIVVISIFGKIMSAPKKHKQTDAKPEVHVKPDIPEVKPIAPVIEDGIGEEIVAVIAAAVAAMSENGTAYAVRSIRKTSADSRSAWAMAGRTENTRSF